jgi:hypothetical protein
MKWPHSSFKDAQSPYRNLFQFIFVNQKLKSGGVISTLKIDSEIAAIHFGFIKDEKFLYFSPTINPKFHKYSPGQLLIHQIIIHLQDSDLQIFDFMNDLEPYKLKWTNQIANRYFYTLYSHKFVTWDYSKYSPQKLLKLLLKPNNLISILIHPILTVKKYQKF